MGAALKTHDRLHQEFGRARRTAFEVTSVGDRAEPCSKILLVGEDNPLSYRPEHALFHLPQGCAGSRLQSMILGVRPALYLAMWRVNLCDGRWDGKEARKNAAALLRGEDPWDLIVMLGAKVAAAFVDKSAAKQETWSVTTRVVEWSGPGPSGWSRQVRLLALPHPSGRCRVWNEPGAVLRARALMAELVPEILWGDS